MSNERLFLDIHAIQTLPPSNVNRDDSGSPKTAQYGGVQRARVSSQSWKKAMRDYFIQSGRETVGTRTKDVVGYVADEISKIDPSFSTEETEKLAVDVIKKAGIKLDKDNKTQALFFMGKHQAQALAQAAIDHEGSGEVLRNILKENPEIDIALFGRMVAGDPSLNEDASAQVAHAISTHAVQTEYDYYAALDDRFENDNAHVAMLDTIEYNSSTLYRYANVAVHELEKQLGSVEKTVDALKLFIEAFSNSMPTGKINTFANETLPQTLMITLRSDRPVSLVGAFETPVRSTSGYVEESTKRLFRELEKVEKFVQKPILTLYVTTTSLDEQVEGKEVPDLAALLSGLDEVKSLLG